MCEILTVFKVAPARGAALRLAAVLAVRITMAAAAAAALSQGQTGMLNPPGKNL